MFCSCHLRPKNLSGSPLPSDAIIFMKMSEACAKHLASINSLEFQHNQKGNIIQPITQMRKLRLRGLV